MKERKEGDSMKPITIRQQQTLDFIKWYIAKHGYAPSVREIGQGIFLTAHSSVCAVLDQLEDQGYIERIAGKARSIRIVGQQDPRDALIESQKEEIEKLKGWVYKLQDAHQIEQFNLNAEIESIKAITELAVNELQFYAESNIKDIFDDMGDKARTTLSEIERLSHETNLP
jgi:SOS-response transcriptional repressor LexA